MSCCDPELPVFGAPSKSTQAQDNLDEFPLEGFSDTDFVDIANLTDMNRAASPDSTITLLPENTDAWPLVADSSTSDIASQSAITIPERQSTVGPGLMPASLDEDQFEEDIDWDTACTLTSSGITPAPKAARLAQSCVPSSEAEHKDELPMSSFVRPPFPVTASNKAQVPGISGHTVLRTCFRVGEMINQTAKCHTQQQDVVFEIYARVKRSDREILEKRQHFLLTDLFKMQPPYPRATFANWRAGSHLDQQAANFLGADRDPKLCWCLCKPSRDMRSTIGWTYTIICIKTVTWEQVQQAKDTLFHARRSPSGE